MLQLLSPLVRRSALKDSATFHYAKSTQTSTVPMLNRFSCVIVAGGIILVAPELFTNRTNCLSVLIRNVDLNLID